MTIAERVARVQRRIQDACAGAGRSPDEVTLVAIGKTFPAHVVRAALDAGVPDLGENRAQELREKALVITDARWHFVGALQTNKVRQVVGVAQLIHSVDRIGVAEAIARRARSIGRVQDVLIEVNIGREPSKSGVDPAAVEALADETTRLEGVRLRGLMAIPPATADPEQARAWFRELRALRDRLAETNGHACELSMGMSRDLEVAVEEGATLVRVGEAIFGPRNR
ncbi:MAG TPA: YggS family pyridoxal phosphate-dependent enzyme [Actinomycetota bacterium]|nr:YggS family pyridoxal phosphate-dependent enzyme [Actinomycetota bacterium]